MVRNAIRLMEILSFIYAFAAVYGEKVRCNIYLVVFGVTELVLLSGINDYGLGAYWLSLSYLLMFIYCLANYKSPVKTTVVNCIIGYAVVAISQIVSYMIISLMVELGNFAVPQKEIIVSLIYMIVIVGFAGRMHLYELAQFFLKRNKLLSGVGFFILVILGSQIWSIKKNYTLDAKMVVLVMCFISLLVIMIYEWDKTRKDAERRKMQLEMNKLYYEAYEGLIKTIREKQHDFKNHLNAIDGMLYSIEDHNELIAKQKAYLREISGNIDSMKLLTMVENPIIAGFLNYEVSRALELGIEIKYKCEFSNHKLKIPEFEVVEMLGILVDNAIEAVMQQEDNRFMEIEMFEDNCKLHFMVTNSYEDSENIERFFDLGYSSKGQNRGIELSKLKHMVNKYNGEIVIAREDEKISLLKIGIIIAI